MRPSAATATTQRRDLAIAGALFMVTLALRIVFLLRSQDTTWPHSVLYEGDAPVWARWAATLAAGQAFEDDLPFRTPGVAFLLRWLGLSTPPFTAAKLVWCVMSAATPALLHLVVARWYGRLAAIVAALLTSVSFGSFALATSLNNEVPYALLVTAAIGLSLAWVDRPGTWRSIALGVLHGAGMLLRAEHLALLALLSTWAAVTAWRRGARAPDTLAQTLLVAGVAVLSCLPWMLRSHAAVERFNRSAPVIVFERSQPPWTPGAIAMFRDLPGFAQAPNYAYLCDLARREGRTQVDEAVVHDFFETRWGSTPEPLATWSIVSFKGPLDFALSNDLRGDGGFSRAALGDAESSDPPFALARPSHAHLVNHGYQVGWQSIRSDPSRWARLALEKLRRFGDGATLGLFANDWPHGTTHDRQAIDLAVPRRGDAIVWNAAMAALITAGVLVAAGIRGGGALLTVLAYRLLVVFAFYGYARHAASIGPVLFALVGLSVQWVVAHLLRIDALRARVGPLRVGAWIVTTLALAVAFATASRPPIWFATPLATGGQITPTPHWHTDAFESVDALVLEPLPPSAR